MTKEELNTIKEQLSQILDDIAGNPDWYGAASALASDIGTLEKNLENMVIVFPSNLDEAAKEFYKEIECYPPTLQQYSRHIEKAFKTGAEWIIQKWKNTFDFEKRLK